MSTATATRTRTVATADPFSDDHGLTTGQLLTALYARSRQRMNDHGLQDWDLVYGGAVSSTLGFTRHDHKRITLSAPLMVTVPGAQRLDTILHEIAHALCEKGEQHGEEWKATARRIGANPKSHVHKEDMGEVKDLPVAATCPAGHEFRRATMPAANRLNIYHCNDRSHRGQSVEQKRITFSWRRTAPKDPQITAAIRKFSKPVPSSHAGTEAAPMMHKVGDRVTIHGTGSRRWDGKEGIIKSIARVNYTLTGIAGELRGVRIKGQYLR